MFSPSPLQHFIATTKTATEFNVLVNRHNGDWSSHNFLDAMRAYLFFSEQGATITNKPEARDSVRKVTIEPVYPN